MKKILSRKEAYPIVIAFVLLTTLLTMSYALADQQAVPPGNANDTYVFGPVSPALPTYPMTLAFSPHTFSLHRGSSKIVGATFRDNGAKAFTATGCKLTIKFSTGHTVAGTCTLATFTFTPHVTYTGKWTFGIGSTAPTGPSTWTVLLTGTVGGAPYQSEPAVLTITIT